MKLKALRVGNTWFSSMILSLVLKCALVRAPVWSSVARFRSLFVLLTTALRTLSGSTGRVLKKQSRNVNLVNSRNQSKNFASWTTHLMKLLMHHVRMLRLMRRQSWDEHVLSSIRWWTSDIHSYTHAYSQRSCTSVSGQAIRRRRTRMKSSSFIVRLDNKSPMFD